MAGKFIVIEGLDGSGKATQTEILRKALEEKGERVRKLTFPDYSKAIMSAAEFAAGGTLDAAGEEATPATT